MFLSKLITKISYDIYLFAEYSGRQDVQSTIVALLGYVPTKEKSEEADTELLLLSEESEYYEEYIRYYVVLMRLGLDDFSRTICDFALFFALYPEVCETFDLDNSNLTMENALKLYNLKANITDEYYNNYDRFKKLTKILATLPSESQLPFFKRSLTFDSRFIEYICIGENEDNEYGGIYKITEADVTRESEVHNEYIAELVKLFENDNAFVHLIGQDSRELLYFASLAGIENNRRFLAVDFDQLYKKFRSDESILWKLKRELIFNEVSLIIHNISFTYEDSVEKWDFCLNFLRGHIINLKGAPICLIGDNTANLTPYLDRVLTVVQVPDYTRAERIELFSYYAEKAGVKKFLDCTDLASKYKLSRHETKKAISIIKRQKNPSEKYIADACNAVIPEPKQGNIKKINATYTLDQLKLHPRQRTAIENIIDHVRHRFKVYDSWGMDKKYAYGKNIVSLLVGPPGTGKTMAVHVMSNILNLPLYSINLSQVVDKYIGETEKRLEEIFEAAEKSNVILFFDEADSIFGKRGEVNDSKDKYANTEVSYILQRLEQYEGIVILATNLKKNIDDAFMRRMRYVVEFPQPTQELRLEIWKSVFADEVPLDNIDFDFLATQFELTGGGIKNIALNATFLAAGNDRAVNMKDILISLRNENMKMGKTMLIHDFDKYSVLMADVI